MESIPAKITGREEQRIQIYSSLTPVFSKKTAYITVRKDYLRKSQAELRTENWANQRFYQLVVFCSVRCKNNTNLKNPNKKIKLLFRLNMMGIFELWKQKAHFNIKQEQLF